MKKILAFIKRETVLMVSLVLAILSMFLVHPDRKYISYIDWHSITLLFCLMAVMAGFKETGLFRTIGNALLAHVHTTRQLFLVLVLLPFVFSMFITNDVSLITFVPFAIIVLSMSEKEHLIIPVVMMQTIAANLGSMLMPMGNPQNLYLYAKSGMSLGTFVEIMLPYTIASLLGILISMFFIKQHAIVIDRDDHAVKLPKKQIILYSIAFVLCLLNVAKLLDIRILFVIILVLFLLVSRKTLLHVDYALLGTFIGFFVFIGNMERVPAFQSFLESIITGRETYIAIGDHRPDQPDHQQRANRPFAVRIYNKLQSTYHRHKPRRARHTHCFDGKPDLLQANCPGISGQKGEIFSVVYGCECGVSGWIDGIVCDSLD